MLRGISFTCKYFEEYKSVLDLGNRFRSSSSRLILRLWNGGVGALGGGRAFIGKGRVVRSIWDEEPVRERGWDHRRLVLVCKLKHVSHDLANGIRNEKRVDTIIYTPEDQGS